MGHPRSVSIAEEEFDRRARVSAQARVVNVSPFRARFEIATMPGSDPHFYSLAPGEAVSIQAGYTHEFQGAGRAPVRATIESITEREAYPRGPLLPCVVHESKAAETKRRWEKAIAAGKAPPPSVEVMLPSADGGEPVKMTVQPAAPVRAAVVEDDEDQDGGPIDEPPPEHNEPEMPIVGASTPPTAPTGKGKSK